MAIKEQLAIMKKALAEAEREYEALARQFTGNGNGGNVALLEARPPRTVRTRGDISLPDAVKAIFPGAGQMHVSVFLEKAQEKGYVTTAENPVDSVDIQLYKLSKTLPIKKVGKRMWEWAD